jgi:hypothetical protein
VPVLITALTPCFGDRSPLIDIGLCVPAKGRRQSGARMNRAMRAADRGRLLPHRRAPTAAFHAERQSQADRPRVLLRAKRGSPPHRRPRWRQGAGERHTDHAAAHARARLRAAGIRPPTDPEALLAAYLDRQTAPAPEPQLCACGSAQPITKRGSRGPAPNWHSDACRKRAGRRQDG